MIGYVALELCIIVVKSVCMWALRTLIDGLSHVTIIETQNDICNYHNVGRHCYFDYL